MSNVGASGSGPWLVNRVVVPVFLRWLRPIIKDKERMESALRASPLDWVAVRLVGITEGTAKPVRMTEDGKGLGFTITAPSIAEFLLARATGPEFLRQTPSVNN